MNPVKNQSIFVKILILFILVIMLSIFSHLLVVQNVQTSFLRKQAKSISRQIVLTRQWIAEMGGVWSKDVYSKSHGFLTDYKAPSTMSQETVFYLHNPALATREISSLADMKYGYVFRVVSDLNWEPTNKPDPFEAFALEKIKSQKMKYVDGIEYDIYRYTEPLYIKKGCLKCHGDLEKDVREPMKSILLAKYGDKAFGYKVGDVSAVISIQIPKEDWMAILTSVFSYWNYVILGIAIVLFYLFARFVIVKPITRLTDAALQLSKGKISVDLGVQDYNQKSRDEIVKLTLAFERLRKSFKILATKLNSARRSVPPSTKS